MIVGVTGSRHGTTCAQLAVITGLLAGYPVPELDDWTPATELRHGDCVGVDREVCYVASRLGIRTVSHPPDVARHRAYAPSDVVLPPLPYVVRNHAIVDASRALVAAPFKAEAADPRSGTWATVRYAARVGRTVVIVYRDASTELR